MFYLYCDECRLRRDFYKANCEFPPLYFACQNCKNLHFLPRKVLFSPFVSLCLPLLGGGAIFGRFRQLSKTAIIPRFWAISTTFMSMNSPIPDWGCLLAHGRRRQGQQLFGGAAAWWIDEKGSVKTKRKTDNGGTQAEKRLRKLRIKRHEVGLCKMSQGPTLWETS